MKRSHGMGDAVMSETYNLYGAVASPFSMKMRAYLRYRRIPFRWISGIEANEIARTKVPHYMVPVLGRPDGTYANDSTPLINELEATFDERRTDPEDPGDAFLAYLIEDFADEWLVNAMFHYRWHGEANQLEASRLILFEGMRGGDGLESIDQMATFWAQRQLKRIPIYAGGEGSFAIVDQTAQELFAIMEAALVHGIYLFGTRPSRAEFALYGQFSQIVEYRYPSDILRRDFPFLVRWTALMNDQSGLEGSWAPLSTRRESPTYTAVEKLMGLIGKTHLPFLEANERAYAAGDETFSFDIDGARYTRAATERNTGCLGPLKDRYAALATDEKLVLEPLLGPTGCLDFLT
ncbi:MAG: glutathione S-transferase N-terminal domain-containing protein [Pseudomonadota bacterium]